MPVCVSGSTTVYQPANKADNEWSHTKIRGAVNVGFPSKVFANPKHSRRFCGVIKT
ncbi:hypothetical protein PCAR4_20003 [Paraburkholderia caribensis]|nr:hypothetical protein PCAR4_20003 [Paraburkholderia caribensis]